MVTSFPYFVSVMYLGDGLICRNIPNEVILTLLITILTEFHLLESIKGHNQAKETIYMEPHRQQIAVAWIDVEDHIFDPPALILTE